MCSEESQRISRRHIYIAANECRLKYSQYSVIQFSRCSGLPLSQSAAFAKQPPKRISFFRPSRHNYISRSLQYAPSLWEKKKDWAPARVCRMRILISVQSRDSSAWMQFSAYTSSCKRDLHTTPFTRGDGRSKQSHPHHIRGNFLSIVLSDPILLCTETKISVTNFAYKSHLSPLKNKNKPNVRVLHFMKTFYAILLKNLNLFC